jgi:hypothetical protein
MPKKRTKLDALSLSDAPAREQTTETKNRSKETNASGSTLRHTSLYLPEPVRRQLRSLAFHEEVKQHDLMLEAIDLLFKSRGAASISELTDGEL